MSKNKNTKNPTQELVPFWQNNWPELDRVFDNFKRDFERTFTSFPGLTLPSMQKISHASCDIIDDGDKFRVKVDVPGVKKDEIKLNITENSVEISAEHRTEEEEKKKNFVRKERSQVSYYRVLPLPERVDSSKTSAKLTDGVLNITLPKTNPTQKQNKKSISVQ
jgi:HSP20 family protein